MLITVLPRPALRPWVKTLWLAMPESELRPATGAREHVLPTGEMHLAFRLGGAPLRLFNGIGDTCGYTVGHTLVGGARSTFYVRDVSTPSCSVGAQLHPGAAEFLFGASATELAERHTPLEDLWGPVSTDAAWERLIEARGPLRKLAVFEALLYSRLPALHAPHPAVAQAIERLTATGSVRDVVRQSGYSHRHFIALFRRSMGLPPKLYRRVLRLQNVLRHVDTATDRSWNDLALDCGYSDQAHFCREFREFTGVTPETYRRISPVFAHHVAIGTVKR